MEHALERAGVDEPAHTEHQQPIPTLQDFETLLSSYPATSSALISLFTLLLSTINTLRNDNIIYSEKIQLYNFLGTATGQVLTDAILERLNALEAENQRLYTRVKDAEAEATKRDTATNDSEMALKDAHTVISQQEDELDRLTATLKEAAASNTPMNGHPLEDSGSGDRIDQDLPRAGSPSASTAATSTSRHSGHKRRREDSRDHGKEHRSERDSSRRRSQRHNDDAEEGHRTSKDNARRDSKRSDKSSSRRSAGETRREGSRDEEHRSKRREDEKRPRSRSRSPHRRRRTQEEHERDSKHERRERSRSRERRKYSSKSSEHASSRVREHDDVENDEEPQDEDEVDPPTVRSISENIPTGPRSHTSSSSVQHGRKASNGSRNPNMLGRLGLPLANGGSGAANGPSSSSASGKGGKGMSILGRGNRS